MPELRVAAVVQQGDLLLVHREVETAGGNETGCGCIFRTAQNEALRVVNIRELWSIIHDGGTVNRGDDFVVAEI